MKLRWKISNYSRNGGKKLRSPFFFSSSLVSNNFNLHFLNSWFRIWDKTEADTKNRISFYVKATISGIDYTWINWTIIMWNFVTKKVETLLCQNFSTFHSEEHNLKEKVKIFRNLTHLSLLHSHIFKNKILITKFAMYLSVLYPTATVFVSRNSHFLAS